MSMTRCPLSDNKKHEFRVRWQPYDGRGESGLGPLTSYPSGYYCVFCLDEYGHVERRQFREELLRVEAVPA